MAFTITQREAILKRLKKLRKKNGVTTMPGVAPSRAYEVAYYREIVRPVNQLTKLLNTEILPAMEALFPAEQEIENGEFLNASPAEERLIRIQLSKFDKFVASFQKDAEKTAGVMVDRNDEYQRRQFVRGVNKTFGISIVGQMSEKGVANVLRRSVKKNTELIVDLPKKYYKQINRIVLDGLTGGDDFTSIRKQLEVLPGINRRRAKLIAVDQTGKLIGELNRVRQGNEGITKYQWNANGDARTRDRHVGNDGEVFDWSDGSPGKAFGRPGEEVRCRCVADAVIDEDVLLNKKLSPKGVVNPAGLVSPIQTIKKATQTRKRNEQVQAAKQFKKKLANVESSIVGNSFETAVAFDSKGREIFRKRGGKNQVTLSFQDRINIRGSVFTHNHPNSTKGFPGGNFSTDDLETFATNGLKELRAIDSENTYSLSGTLAPDRASAFIKASIEKERGALRDARDWYRVKTRNGTPLGAKELNQKVNEYRHENLNSLAKVYKIKYERTPLNGN